MPFRGRWTEEADAQFEKIRSKAAAACAKREQGKQTKTSKAEGLFKQVDKCARFLLEDPRHPGLQTHEYDSIPHPYTKGGKVFEAYVQNRTPGAYRLFWCYGPEKGDITILAITPHP